MNAKLKQSLKIVKRTLLFLLGAVLVVYAHYSNEQYKERHGIEATTGATELAD